MEGISTNGLSAAEMVAFGLGADALPPLQTTIDGTYAVQIGPALDANLAAGVAGELPMIDDGNGNIDGSDTNLDDVNANCEDGSEECGNILYYKIPVDFEIMGSFLGYLKFRRELSKSLKVINFDNEEIVALKEPQGQIIAKGTISIVGLPNEYN